MSDEKLTSTEVRQAIDKLLTENECAIMPIIWINGFMTNDKRLSATFEVISTKELRQ